MAGKKKKSKGAGGGTGGGGKKKKGKGGKRGAKTAKVKLNDDDLKLLMLCLQVESKSQAVLFYRNWCKEQSIDLKILHQKAALSRKRQHTHLKSIDATNDDLFGHTYGAYMFVDPSHALAMRPTPDPPHGPTGSTTTASTRLGPTTGPGRTPTANSRVRAAVTVISAISSMRPRRPSESVHTPPTLPIVPCTPPTPPGPPAPSSPVRLALPPRHGPVVHRSERPAPAAVVPIAATRGADLVATTTAQQKAIPVPSLGDAPEVVAGIQAMRERVARRDALAREIAELDVYLGELRNQTSDEIIESLESQMQAIRLELESAKAKFRDKVARIERRHKDAIHQTNAHAEERIRNVNQLATEAEIHRMSPIHTNIIDKHKRLQRELASIRAQEAALAAEVEALEAQVAALQARNDVLIDANTIPDLSDARLGTSRTRSTARAARDDTTVLRVDSDGDSGSRRRRLSGWTAGSRCTSSVRRDSSPGSPDRPPRSPLPRSPQSPVPPSRRASIPVRRGSVTPASPGGATDSPPMSRSNSSSDAPPARRMAGAPAPPARRMSSMTETLLAKFAVLAAGHRVRAAAAAADDAAKAQAAAGKVDPVSDQLAAARGQVVAFVEHRCRRGEEGWDGSLMTANTAAGRPSAKHPLHGMLVIELGGLAPVPFAGMVLADLGATVLRVDRPRSSASATDLLTRGKRAVQLDLKSREGQARLWTLIRHADVLLDPYRPGIFDAMGFTPDAMHAVNPGLVVARLVGFPRDGVKGKQAGHDITYLAASGVLSALGRNDTPPMFPVNLIADFAGGGLLCATLVLGALVQRATTGRGAIADVNMVQGAQYVASFLRAFQHVGLATGDRGTNLLDSGAPHYDVYETQDGQFLAVGALEPQFYAALLAGLRTDLPPAEYSHLSTVGPPVDPESWPAIRATFTRVFLSRPLHEWKARFDGTDACVEPVVPMRNVKAWPVLTGTGTVVPGGEDAWEPIEGEWEWEKVETWVKNGWKTRGPARAKL
ncbi:hypothetical protein AMAG_20377 [Allomyces macrogynus ATCC 38327]|uniref:Alpha-methylacyl-CoA racemase n=1 Tax=Allomyces macrogynus (strain ATCC 38327) TaxID=578462 RepID=A0A0L0TAF6_ALLM3|nr:hypothetical protein AMAG_20377 [Allomyces macrogynus ATCC 38327]|eukprot:KNE71514.1 hypothetical protein AMAG_20377 [Allomyces macrogynus ATCC 38327]